MKRRLLARVAVWFMLLLPQLLMAQSNTKLPTTKTESGMVSGLLNKDGQVASYKGIPFAAPPVSDLRWKEPQPAKPWSGTLACDKFPASPIQSEPKAFMMWSEEFITPAKPLSEDCLYLNIWTSAKKADEKQPVFVWIHGGAFVSGSGACPVYDGEAMAKKGIVFVSINYRLGIFGFMAHPELTKESSHHASGNYGLLDQVAALQWINRNISAFGGDPSKVTIAGQSAGSFAVQALVASPLTHKLFRGAIAQSGASLDRMSKGLADAEKTGESLSEKLNKRGLERLRKISSDSLLLLANTFPFGSFAPIKDGYVLPEDMKTIFLNKKQNDVALLAGWVTGDAGLVGQAQPMDQFKAFASTTYGDKKDDFLKIFPANSEEESRQSQQKLALLNFAAFADHRWALANSSNSFLYQFVYVPTDKPGFPNYGAFHTSEVPFALHTLAYWSRPWKGIDYKVEEYMSEYWINFVKTGNPNGKGLPKWEKYNDKTESIMELGERPVLKPGLFKKEFTFFESMK